MPLIANFFDDTRETQFTYNKRYIFFMTLVVALGGLLFGFDLSIISGTVSAFTQYFNLNEVEVGWAVGSINLGAALGALLAGKLSDSIGRKKVLVSCALLFALTGVGTGWAESFSVFIIFRMGSGVAVGMAALVCPMYIAEMAPAKIRGRLVAFYQLAIVIGLLLAYVSNYFLLDTGENNWRWMFSSQSAPALFFFFGLFLVSESPRWLIRNNRENEARNIMQKIGGVDYAQIEIESIRKSFSYKREKIKDLLSKDLRGILLIGILIAIFSQTVGQNSIFSYAPEIFKNAGMAEDSAFLQSVIVGLVNLAFTFVAIFSIDKTGRKNLLKYGAILLFFDAGALAFSFYLELSGVWILTFVLGFIAVYAATLGPVTWVTVSEIFPNRVRGNAMSLATLALWIANFFTTASFPILKSAFGLPITFGIHGIICLIYFIFIFFRIPETKGKSLEEIEEMVKAQPERI